MSGGEEPSDSQRGSVADGAAETGCSRILGSWLWNNGVTVTVHPNNRTTQTDGHVANVVCAKGFYTFTWNRLASTRMTLSADGNRLSGTSLIGPTSAVRK